MSQSFDVVVIGGGPGGYVAAIRCAQLGLNTACVDEWRNPKGEAALGGTCLNVGCIPSKALLESSENYERARHKFAAHGVMVKDVTMDVAAMMARKDKIVATLTGGIKSLFRKNKVTWLQGHGKLVRGEGGCKVEVAAGGKMETLQATQVIIATGSKARHLPEAPVDNAVVVDNEGALSFSEVPGKLGVIGAGVVGLELGSVWRRLGAKVSILEALEGFLPAADEAVAREAWKIFTKEQGLEIHLGATIKKATRDKKSINVEYETKNGPATLMCDRLIVSVGRVPNTDRLGAEAVGLKLDGRGFIEVDAQCRSNLANVFAIGDVVRGPMLAHKAEEEGVMVAEIIAGQAGHLNLETIPWVIYTSPEVAWVGKTSQQLKTEGVEFLSGQFPVSANGRALGQGETAGFVKILADARSDRILGVHIIASHASELIAEAVVAMEFGASSEDIARIVHAHPSLSEVVHEAALAVGRRAIHI